MDLSWPLVTHVRNVRWVWPSRLNILYHTQGHDLTDVVYVATQLLLVCKVHGILPQPHCIQLRIVKPVLLQALCVVSGSGRPPRSTISNHTRCLKAILAAWWPRLWHFYLSIFTWNISSWRGHDGKQTPLLPRFSHEPRPDWEGWTSLKPEVLKYAT